MNLVLAGRYHIIKPLGIGGFGQTFLATDRHLPGKPICVVKQLHPGVSSPQALQVAQRLFNLEAEILYRLGRHDQIPQLLAHFEQGGEFYLVQEFIDGQILSQEFARRKQFRAWRIKGRKWNLVYGVHYRNDQGINSEQPTWKVHLGEYYEFTKIPPDQLKAG
ncbi:protein kinase [Leptolyngbya sp. GB1-A1]|uniref:serine/threonine protein kinase n=1 Tax=Leptolyngbya sp. GB1-A1 TaxID=2933908 RepID=UPI0032997FFD